MGTTRTNSSIGLVLVTLLRPLNASPVLSRYANGLPHSVSFKHEVLALAVSASLLHVVSYCLRATFTDFDNIRQCAR